MTTPIDLIEELRWRGMLHQCTDEKGLGEHLASGTRRIYAGLDPTADSLTIGNLVTIMALAHAKRAGHEAVVVMGGGTGLIGDPSGKSDERTLMTRERVLANVEAQRPIYEAVLGPVDGPPHLLRNNLDWLGGLSYIDALRDIGKHFSVNMMMQKESVKERLHNREQGISYTEFSYMILQAYDFLELFQNSKKHKLSGPVTVQFGGSDQFGNIVAGLDLIHKERTLVIAAAFATIEIWLETHPDALSGVTSLQEIKRLISEIDHLHATGKPYDDQVSCLVDILRTLLERVPELHLDAITRLIQWLRPLAFGLTWPLVTKSDGGKFGKTESGAVWLTADRTSPYAYYQFWLNATDADAANWLKVFTFLSREEIDAITTAHAADPGRREAQRRLAQEATKILHGQAAMEQAEAAGKALFSGEIAHLDAPTLADVFANVPTSEHALERLAAGADPLDLLVETGLAASRREGREFLANGSVTINGRKITPLERLSTTDLLHGSLIAIRRGKKAWHLTRWVE